MIGLGFRFPKRWPTYTELGEHAKRMVQVRASSPEPIVLGNPTILDQGNSSACGGFDLVQCVHIWKQAHGVPSVIGSPQLPYWNARRYGVHRDEDVRDDGIDPDNMVLAASDFGCCTLEDCPFSDDPAEINRKPGPLAYQNGQSVLCKLSPIFEVGDALVDAIKYTLSVKKNPVFGAIEVVPAYDQALSRGSNGICDDPSGASRGGHAIPFIGWRTDGRIISPGSWGADVGDHGVAYLGPEFIGQRCMYAAEFEVLPS